MHAGEVTTSGSCSQCLWSFESPPQLSKNLFIWPYTLFPLLFSLLSFPSFYPLILYFTSSGPCENSQLPETREVLRTGHELGICKTQEPLTRAMLNCDWMRQQVVKGPLKINVIMKALRGGLSGLGSDRRQEEEEEGAASIMFRQQNPFFFFLSQQGKKG